VAEVESGVTKISLYDFFMRCEMIPDIDSHFQPFLHPPSLPGDTVSIGEDGRSTSTVSATSMTDELLAL
jgi:hypothetical protein